jgi:hypothetical protein
LDMSFEVIKPLPQSGRAQGAADLGEFKSVGENERTVFERVRPGRDVQGLVDVSCLGEFETCKALCHLVNLGYLRPILPSRGVPRIESPGILRRTGDLLVRGALSLMVIAAGAWVVSQLNVGAFGVWRTPSASYVDPAVQRFIARAQLERISSALALCRLEGRELPSSLESLVDLGFLRKEELRYPWRDPYYYRRINAREFILLPPLR